MAAIWHNTHFMIVLIHKGKIFQNHLGTWPYIDSVVYSYKSIYIYFTLLFLMVQIRQGSQTETASVQTPTRSFHVFVKDTPKKYTCV